MLLRVRLTRKLAEVLDGVDVSQVQEGDCLDLPPREARLLIAEGWAELADPQTIDTPVDVNIPDESKKSDVS